jgi:hypothetical protein
MPCLGTWERIKSSPSPEGTVVDFDCYYNTVSSTLASFSSPFITISAHILLPQPLITLRNTPTPSAQLSHSLPSSCTARIRCLALLSHSLHNQSLPLHGSFPCWDRVRKLFPGEVCLTPQARSGNLSHRCGGRWKLVGWDDDHLRGDGGSVLVVCRSRR